MDLFSLDFTLVLVFRCNTVTKQFRILNNFKHIAAIWNLKAVDTCNNHTLNAPTYVEAPHFRIGVQR
jgi:hypothetical protein